MNRPAPRLIEAIGSVGRQVPQKALEAICQNLETLTDDSSWRVRHALLSHIPQATTRELTSELFSHWEREAPELPPQSLAWSLRTAGWADEHYRSRQVLELVWTGPTAAGSPLRRTDQVLLEMISQARQELLIVTFAVYQIPEITSALVEAADRGVAIRLVAEPSEQAGGKMGYDVLAAWGTEVTSKATIYIWPRHRRQVDSRGKHGALHAKCAVADRDTMLISSANLTGYALNLNMEMGLLVRGGTLPREVWDHFDKLIDQGSLERLTR